MTWVILQHLAFAKIRAKITWKENILYRFIESACGFTHSLHNTCFSVTQSVSSVSEVTRPPSSLGGVRRPTEWFPSSLWNADLASAGLSGLRKAGPGAQLRLGLGRLRVNTLTPSFAGFWQEPQSRRWTDHGYSFHVHAEISSFQYTLWTLDKWVKLEALLQSSISNIGSGGG